MHAGRSSHVRLFTTQWTVAHSALLSMKFSKKTGGSYHALLQGIFLTQGSILSLTSAYWEAGSFSLAPSFDHYVSLIQQKSHKEKRTE